MQIKQNLKNSISHQTITHGYGSSTSLSYQTYYALLISERVRYNKTKKANIGKRGNVYNPIVEPTYVDHPQDASDFAQESPCIDLPSDEFYQIHSISSRHPPLPMPGSPSNQPFRPQSKQSGPLNS